MLSQTRLRMLPVRPNQAGHVVPGLQRGLWHRILQVYMQKQECTCAEGLLAFRAISVLMRWESAVQTGISAGAALHKVYAV